MPSTILSDNGVSSGTSGIKTTGSNDGALALQTTTAGGTATTAISIDTSQRVGVGVASPTWRLEVAGNSGSEFRVFRGTNEFGISMSNNAGSVAYAGTTVDSPLALMTNQTERLRLNSSGTVILQGGSTSATGVGITFPATQSASSDANTLDDYEQGNWTPTVRGSSTAGTYTLSNIKAYYTKIGNQVTCWASFGFSAASGGTGNIRVEGLPFNYKANSTGANSILLDNVDLPTSSVGIGLSPASSASAAIIYPYAQKDNAGTDEIPISGVTTASSFYFTFIYTVD